MSVARKKTGKYVKIGKSTDVEQVKKYWYSKGYSVSLQTVTKKVSPTENKEFKRLRIYACSDCAAAGFLNNLYKETEALHEADL